MKIRPLKTLVVLGVLSIATYAAAYTYTTKVTISFVEDVGTANNTGTLVIGTETGLQLGIDNNEIQARKAGGGNSIFHLQHGGGELAIGSQRVSLNHANPVISMGGTDVLGIDTFAGEAMADLRTPFVSVEGRAFFFDDIDALGNIMMSSLPFAGGPPMCMNGSGQIGMCTSSGLYKTDIRPLEQGLSKVMSMKPVTFAWREGNVPDIGFVAEEAERVVPELAVRNKDENVRGFNYQHYTAVLTLAVQEQQAIIEEQRADLASLKAELGILYREVAALRASVDLRARNSP